MKTLLINPNSNFLINEKVFPSLGLLYLSAYLKAHGYRDISLIDMNDEKPLPDNLDADVVGFYSNTPQFPTVVRLIREIRKINRAKDPLYILGGPHVSGKHEDAIDECDVVVAGEGERALLDILRRKEKQDRQERIVRYEYIKDLDSLPFPDRDIIDIKGYKYYLEGRPVTTVISSRGCPYSCKFCANNTWGKTLRFRSPRNVLEEIRFLMDKYGYKAFMFFDDTMTVNKKRMFEICKGLRELDIIYRCFIRSDTVDRAILKEMQLSGCVEVGMGIESGSQRILDIVSKNETVEQNMKTIISCHDIGMRVKGFFIVGLPGEDKVSIRETTEFLEAANLDDIDISIYKPYPGSFIYKNREEFDIDFEDDYEHAWFKGKPGNYSTTTSTKAFSPADILKIRDELEERFKKSRRSKELYVSR